jgi:fermentation-respiration switch protein FrsA (DUF1100 family)
MSVNALSRGPLAKKMASFGVTLALAYFAILFFTVLFEKKLIYFPNIPGRLEGDWSPEGLPLENITLETADAVKLHAWWIPAENAEFTFLAFHGNAANIANRADVYRFLHALPVNVLAVEYRGYGKSEGTPGELGLYLDAEAAMEYVRREHNIPSRQVIAFGQSLGTAVAADLASRHDLGGLVLEAPFASARTMARRLYWFLPGLSFVLRTKFDTAQKLNDVSAPVLVVHCSQDPVIPLAMGEEVYRLARAPKQFLRVDEFCHEEASLVDPGGYRAKLLELLETVKSRAGGSNSK